MKKMGKILGIFTFIMMFIPSLVFAEEMNEAFNQILNEDGKLVITQTTSGDKLSLINDILMRIQVGEGPDFFRAEECNENFTSCRIIYGTFENFIDEQWIDLVWDEEKSEQFLNVIGDKVTITSNSLDGRERLLWNFIGSLDTNTYQIQFSGCNDDYTSCTFEVSLTSEYKPEKHVTAIEYKEKISDEFKKIAKDNKIAFQTIKPKDSMEADFFINDYLSKYNKVNTEVYVGSCNDNYTKCDLVLQKYENNGYNSETHVVSVTFVDLDKTKAKAVNKVLASLPEDKTFIVEDLEVINYLVNSGIVDDDGTGNYDTAFLNYSTDLKKVLGNKNITATLVPRGGGGGSMFINESIGGYSVKYDGVTYGVFQGGAILRYVLYVPSDTPNTPEAYKAAAQKRINEYLGHNKVKLDIVGELSDFDPYEYEELNLGNKIGNHYYGINYKGMLVSFIIARDSSKMKDMEPLVTSDVMTDISISTDSTSVPLDTVIQATELNSGAEYDRIIKILNVDDNLTYDLKLYSGASGKYITKLNDGKFEVKIPVPENFKGKTLVAYYVNSDGKVEDYEAELVEEDKYAVFTTDHFSIYTLAATGDKLDEEVPPTFDGIATYVMVGLTGLTGLGSCVLLKKKEN